ncbi:MAG: hypothetical protein J6H31_05985 [Butyrivibrio sp.]|nr:hypothetical protein [Butyrivibrio sp.]
MPKPTASIHISFDIGRIPMPKPTASIHISFDIGRIPPQKSTATIHKFLYIGRFAHSICTFFYPSKKAATDFSIAAVMVHIKFL